jgi:hypothetical protein
LHYFPVTKKLNLGRGLEFQKPLTSTLHCPTVKTELLENIAVQQNDSEIELVLSQVALYATEWNKQWSKLHIYGYDESECNEYYHISLYEHTFY